MDLNKLFDIFVLKCKTVNKFINTKKGRNLFLVACVVFVLLFLAPLFHGAVGSALIGCVIAPMTVLIWRRYDKSHAIVPAVFFSAPMIIDMILYHNLSTAACLLVGCVCTLLIALHSAFDFIIKIEDNMYAYLASGGICVCIVVLASLLILLVSIAWWLFCLFLFVALVAVFFSVVLSTAAYTATDDKRQQRKKERKQYDVDTRDYDFDTFAEDIGLKNEHLYNQRNSRQLPSASSRRQSTRRKDEPLFYDIDE